MTKVKLEHILLGVLLQQPQTGYELQRFMETTGRFMRTNTSMTQVYRSLRKMDDDGWLDHEVEPRLGARDAKRYSVTPTGRAAFFSWLRRPHEPIDFPADPGFDVILRFTAEYLGVGPVVEMLDAEIAFRRQQIARNRHRDRIETYEPAAPIDADLAGAIMNWQHRRGAARMDRHLEAIVELRDLLAAGELPETDQPSPLVPLDGPGEQRKRA